MRCRGPLLTTLFSIALVASACSRGSSPPPGGQAGSGQGGNSAGGQAGAGQGGKGSGGQGGGNDAGVGGQTGTGGAAGGQGGGNGGGGGSPPGPASEADYSMDVGWQFNKSDVSGAQATTFADTGSGWS